VACVLLLTGYWAAAYGAMRVMLPGYRVLMVAEGCVADFGHSDLIRYYAYWHPSHGELPTVESWRATEPMLWMPRWRADAVGWSVRVPLWIPLAVALGVTGLLWRTPHRPGTCRRGRYDLTGITGPSCPECGASVPSAPGGDL
jgi:hypothetical protein